MSTEPKEANDQNNSAPVNSDDKSEEFLNFERGMKIALGLSKEQAREVVRKSQSDEEPGEEAENS